MQLEETQIALARAVVFLRTHPCPYHEHADMIMVTHDGPTVIHGPVCELMPEIVQDCEFRAEREELLDECYQALGTKDMSNFV